MSMGVVPMAVVPMATLEGEIVVVAAGGQRITYGWLMVNNSYVFHKRNF